MTTTIPQNVYLYFVLVIPPTVDVVVFHSSRIFDMQPVAGHTKGEVTGYLRLDKAVEVEQ